MAGLKKPYMSGGFKIRECDNDGTETTKHWHVENMDGHGIIAATELDAQSWAFAGTIVATIAKDQPTLYQALSQFVIDNYPIEMEVEEWKKFEVSRKMMKALSEVNLTDLGGLAD